HQDIGVLVHLVRGDLAPDDLGKDVSGVVGGHEAAPSMSSLAYGLPGYSSMVSSTMSAASPVPSSSSSRSRRSVAASSYEVSVASSSSAVARMPGVSLRSRTGAGPQPSSNTRRPQ